MTRAEKRRRGRRMARMAMRNKPKRGGLEPLIYKGFGIFPEHVRLGLISGRAVRTSNADCYGPDCDVRHDNRLCAGRGAAC